MIRLFNSTWSPPNEAPTKCSVWWVRRKDEERGKLAITHYGGIGFLDFAQLGPVVRNADKVAGVPTEGGGWLAIQSLTYLAGQALRTDLPYDAETIKGLTGRSARHPEVLKIAEASPCIREPFVDEAFCRSCQRKDDCARAQEKTYDCIMPLDEDGHSFCVGGRCEQCSLSIPKRKGAGRKQVIVTALDAAACVAKNTSAGVCITCPRRGSCGHFYTNSQCLLDDSEECPFAFECAGCLLYRPKPYDD